MNYRYQLWAVWCAPIATIGYIIAFAFIAKFVPPSSPLIGTEQLVSFYQENRNLIRSGQLLGLVFSIFFLPWFAILSLQMAKVEGKVPILSLIQFGGGLILIVYFILCSMLWTIAAYRADINPEMLQLIHDSSWLFFVMVYPEYTLQLIAIALVGFMDKREQPLFPRWVCYLNLWAAFSAIGGGFAGFFHSGPFAYNGLFGFYIPVAFFLLWLAIMVPLMLKAVKRDQQIELSNC